jgi:hypothetical protein
MLDCLGDAVQKEGAERGCTACGRAMSDRPAALFIGWHGRSRGIFRQGELERRPLFHGGEVVERSGCVTREERLGRFLHGGERFGQFADVAVGVIGQITMIVKRDNQDGKEEKNNAQ